MRISYWSSDVCSSDLPEGVKIADRHYNRQKIGSPQFVPPGRCAVLINTKSPSLWVTSWPFAQYVKHAWAGAWVNSLFRHEGQELASDLILDGIGRASWRERVCEYV